MLHWHNLWNYMKTNNKMNSWCAVFEKARDINWRASRYCEILRDIPDLRIDPQWTTEYLEEELNFAAYMRSNLRDYIKEMMEELHLQISDLIRANPWIVE